MEIPRPAPLLHSQNQRHERHGERHFPCSKRALILDFSFAIFPAPKEKLVANAEKLAESDGGIFRRYSMLFDSDLFLSDACPIIPATLVRKLDEPQRAKFSESESGQVTIEIQGLSFFYLKLCGLALAADGE